MPQSGKIRGILASPGGLGLSQPWLGGLGGGGAWAQVWPWAGIDLMRMGSEFMMVEGEDRARKAWNLCRKICEYQETFLVLEKGGWMDGLGGGGRDCSPTSLMPVSPVVPEASDPVIAAVRGTCVGAGELGGGAGLGSPPPAQGLFLAGVDLISACDTW